MISAEYVLELLYKQSCEEHAEVAQRFFKTGKGEYGEGDIFWGIRVPQLRTIAGKVYRELDEQNWLDLMTHEVHEVRLAALFILTHWYEKAKTVEQKEHFANLYIEYRAYVNNWDLVDTSAHKILGDWFWDRDHSLLINWTQSSDLWETRIAVVTTYRFIKRGDFTTILHMAELLLHHPHDLIHKAVGWMLREAGKMDESVLIEFLNNHYSQMPRTMLRYAIERLEEPLRLSYLLGKVKN